MSNQRGYILIGIMIAMVIMASTLPIMVDTRLQAIKYQKQLSTIQGGRQITDAILNYYVDHATESGGWPYIPFDDDGRALPQTTMEILVDAGYLMSGDDQSLYGSSWRFWMDDDSEVGILDLIVPTILDARFIAASFPNARNDGTRVIVTVKRPGDEIIHLLLYARDGRRKLQGDLQVNSNALENVGAITYE